MIKHGVVAGLLVGIALVLVSIYPVLSFYTRDLSLSADWFQAARPLLLIVSGAAVLVVATQVGSLAARTSGASEPIQGFRVGAISGVVVGLVFYSLLLSPTIAVTASIKLWKSSPAFHAPYPPVEAIRAFLNETTRTVHLRLYACLAAGALLGGVEGAITGWRRRRQPAPRPTLLDVLETPNPRQRWFSGSDEVWRAGLIAGLIGGTVTWLSITVSFFSGLEEGWPELQLAALARTDLITRFVFNDMLMSCLFPLFVLAVLGTGALAVILLKDPPRRHLSRFQVVLIAALVMAIMVSLAVMQMAFAGMGMARYEMFNLAQYAQTEDPGAEFYVDAQALEVLRQFIRSPEMMAPLFYLVPLILFAVVLMMVLFWFAPQAVFYGLTLPLVFRRPVDRAARVVRAIRSQPNGVLPRIYGLYTNDARAVRVLPHLAFQLRGEPAAEVAAAYHVLSSQVDQTERAAAVVRQTVAQQEGWRWRTEVGELYRILEDGLAAKSLSQVTAIQPPPRDVTSSLPPVLAKSCEGIGRVLGELKKVERVDDLSTKLIFLNSSQAALLDLRRRTIRDIEECEACGTPFPEIAILHSLMDFWQGFVLTASRDLQGRADLHAELVVQRAGFGPKVRQCVVVTNQGLNVAQNLRLQVTDGEGYAVLDGAEQHVEILSPQESRELEFWLAPDGPRRLRLTWRLTFDDAVDIGRQVDFADAMELEEDKAVRPFKRIFPIPYVTGTPLRSGEMFVGRQDVFEFVKEHLLGTYQNNVIVLHGQRRTGKTSILYHLQRVLADSHAAVLIDMQGKAARGTADFLYALSDDIVYSLEKHDILADLPDRSEYEEAPEFTFGSRFLRSVVDRLDNRNLLLMFDEFEELQHRVEDGRLEPGIFPYLRNLMQHEPRVDFVFSGTHKLEELGAEYWSILFNIATYKRITFLDPDETRRLVTEPVAPYNMEYDPLAVERIIQVTAGHPYFAQVVCHELVAYHNETERNYLTVTSVDEVLERIIERGEAHFKYIWAEAEPEEQWVMLALTDLLPDADALVAPSQIAEELARKGYDLPQEDRIRALARLQTKDIIARSGPQSTLYRFKIDLIRRWIRTVRPTL